MPGGAPATFWRPRSPYARGVIGATAIWTLTSLGLCSWAHPALLVVDGTIPCAAGAALGTYLLLRSLRFAAIAGLICAGAIVSSCGTLTVLGWLLPHARSGAIWNFSGPPGGLPFAIFMDGLVAAGLVLWQLQRAAAEVSAGAAPDVAAHKARDATLGLGVASLLCVTAPVLLPLHREFRHLEFYSASSLEASAIAAILSAVIVMWLCFVVMPLLVAGNGFSEQAIVKINRRQERFQRALVPLEVPLESRWSLSITGIAAILFALISLDRVHTSGGSMVLAVPQIWNAQAVTFYGTLLAILIIGLVWTRSWRKALSSAIAAIYCATFAAWFALRTHLVPAVDAVLFDYFPILGWEMAAVGSAAIAAMVFLVGSAGMRGAQGGKDAQHAMTGALAESAGAVICIAVAAMLASALAFTMPGIILSIASVLAALVLFPCFYVAVNALLPRYRSAEEVFGRE